MVFSNQKAHSCTHPLSTDLHVFCPRVCNLLAHKAERVREKLLHVRALSQHIACKMSDPLQLCRLQPQRLLRDSKLFPASNKHVGAHVCVCVCVHGMPKQTGPCFVHVCVQQERVAPNVLGGGERLLLHLRCDGCVVPRELR